MCLHWRHIFNKIIQKLMEQDQDFLEFAVKALVDNPDDVKVNRTVDEMGVLLTLDVHKDDMGKIIGRAGNTAKALRTLLRVVGMKNDARVNLKINEPEGGEPREPREPRERREEAPAATEAPAPVKSDAEEMSAEEKSATSKSVDEAMEDLGL